MKENEKKTLLRSSDDLIAAVEQCGFLPFFRNEIHGFSIEAVSYTHLDVYKRQALRWSLTPFWEVLASEAVLLRRSGKIRSTELFSFQGAAKWSD